MSLFKDTRRQHWRLNITQYRAVLPAPSGELTISSLAAGDYYFLLNQTKSMKHHVIFLKIDSLGGALLPTDLKEITLAFPNVEWISAHGSFVARGRFGDVNAAFYAKANAFFLQPIRFIFWVCWLPVEEGLQRSGTYEFTQMRGRMVCVQESGPNTLHQQNFLRHTCRSLPVFSSLLSEAARAVAAFTTVNPTVEQLPLPPELKQTVQAAWLVSAFQGS